jgi:hypothetical protein
MAGDTLADLATILAENRPRGEVMFCPAAARRPDYGQAVHPVISIATTGPGGG